MKNTYQEHLPRVPITVLATLCFVTLIMCQTRFKISKEMSTEVYPPVIRSKECWFLYTIGNPDSFKCVLRIFIVITSPVLSLISTALLLFGKIESNPYFFIPWLFLTMKGLLLIQTDNLITILRDMSTRANYTFGFRMEDFKWMIFYFTIFVIDFTVPEDWEPFPKVVETFSFCEIFDLFLVLWNRHPSCNLETSNIEAVKKDIADIMKSLSKCSFGSLSKISLGSTSDSEETNESREGNVKDMASSLKLSTKDEDKLVDVQEPLESLPKGDTATKSDFLQKELKSNVEEELKLSNQAFALKVTSEGDVIAPQGYENMPKVDNLTGSEGSSVHKMRLKTLPSTEERTDLKSNGDIHPSLGPMRAFIGDVCS